MSPFQSPMPVTEPAPHRSVVLTALFILAVFAVVLPMTGEGVLLLNVLTTGWIPALWAARLGWAANRGAIRARIGRRDNIGEVGDQRWTIWIRDPRILTRDGDPFLFRAYFLMELVLCLLTWLLILGPVLARVA
jgi:hypothetical protein